MGTPSSILAWEIPWTEDLTGYSPWGSKGLDTTEQLIVSLSVFLHRPISETWNQLSQETRQQPVWHAYKLARAV